VKFEIKNGRPHGRKKETRPISILTGPDSSSDPSWEQYGVISEGKYVSLLFGASTGNIAYAGTSFQSPTPHALICVSKVI